MYPSMEDDIEEEVDEEDNYYAPLTCDLCRETFKTPALWVRHVETHPTNDLPPMKRRKVSRKITNVVVIAAGFAKKVFMALG